MSPVLPPCATTAPGKPARNLAKAGKPTEERTVVAPSPRFVSRFGTRCLLVSCLAAASLTAKSGRAEANERVAYSQKQVYSAAIRYLRIDRRYEITERDPEAAYVLFEYEPMGQRTRRFGAVEIVKLQQGVRLVVRLPDQPSYQETMLRDGLLDKLRADYGEMAPTDKPAKPPSEESPRDKPEPDGSAPPAPRRPNARS